MTSLLHMVQPTREERPLVATNGSPPMDKLMMVQLMTMRPQTVRITLHKEKTPMEPPDQPIPPKSPYNVCKDQASMMWPVFLDCTKSHDTLLNHSQHYLAQERERDISPTSRWKQLEQQPKWDPQQDLLWTSNTMILQKKSRDFCLQLTEWEPMIEPGNGVALSSPLLWMMVHLSSATWHQTYTWNRLLDEYMPPMACPLLHSKPVFMSHALWNVRSPLDWPVITPCMASQSTMQTSDQTKQTMAKGLQSIPLTIVATPHTIHQYIVLTNRESKSPILLTSVCNLTIHPLEWKPTIECKERYVKPCSITVSNGYLQAQFAKGNWNLQLPSTIHHHNPPPATL